MGLRPGVVMGIKVRRRRFVVAMTLSISGEGISLIFEGYSVLSVIIRLVCHTPGYLLTLKPKPNEAISICPSGVHSLTLDL